MGYGKCIYGFPFEKLWIKRYFWAGLGGSVVKSPPANIQEDPTVSGVTKAHGPQLLSSGYRSQEPQPRSHVPQKLEHPRSMSFTTREATSMRSPHTTREGNCNAKPMQSETRVVSALATARENPHSKKGPA